MESPKHRNGPLVCAIIVIGLLIRATACFWNTGQYSSDPDAYRALAESLAQTGVYGLVDAHGQSHPTAFRPPLYPFLLSWFVVDTRLPEIAIAVFHTVLGAITILCTFLASQKLVGTTISQNSLSPPPGSSLRVSIVAAGCVAVDPILLQQSTLVMTETLATTLASLVIWWWVCHLQPKSSLGNAAILGVLLALAYLCRPTFLVWAAMLSVTAMLGLAGNSLCWRQRVARGVIIGSIVAAAMIGWMIRNGRELGHPVWATTHGGYTLLLANNPLFYDYLDDGDLLSAWDAEKFLNAYQHRYDGDPTSDEFWRRDWNSPATIDPAITEVDDDRYIMEAAKATISRQTSTFIWSCFVRVGRLWSPLPHRTPGRGSIKVIAIGLYYFAFYVALIVGIYRIGRSLFRPQWWAIGTLVLTLTLVHAIYWSNLRMRAPAIPGMAILAAACLLRPADQETDDGPA